MRGMWYVGGTGEFHAGFQWGVPEGKSPLGRHRSRGEDNIKIDIQYVGWGGMCWMHLVKGRDG